MLWIFVVFAELNRKNQFIKSYPNITFLFRSISSVVIENSIDFFIRNIEYTLNDKNFYKSCNSYERYFKQIIYKTETSQLYKIHSNFSISNLICISNFDPMLIKMHEFNETFTKKWFIIFYKNFHWIPLKHKNIFTVNLFTK